MEPSGEGRTVTWRRLVFASPALTAVLLTTFAITAAALGAVPVSLEFQINSYTTSDQRFASVAVDADGDFVVVWESYGSAGSDTGYSVQGQRYDAGGNAVGTEFQVNSYTTSSQLSPSVASHADGDLVFAWESFASSGSDTSGTSIQARIYFAPEPSEFWMLVAGIAFLASVGRRRIKA